MSGIPYSPTLPYSSVDFMFRVFNHFCYPFRVQRTLQPSASITSLHRHDFPQVWYCVNDSYRHYVEDMIYPCTSGSLLIIPPGYGHGFDIDKGITPDLVCLQGTIFFFTKLPEPLRTNLITNLFLQRFSSELKFEPKIFYQLEGQEKERFENLLLPLSCVNWEKMLPNIVQLRRKAGELFSLQSFEISEKQRVSARRIIDEKLFPIMNVLLYINKNFAKKITSNTLVKLSTMSYSEFFKYFKKVTGMTYTEYLQLTRVRRALMFISQTSYSFEYIADLCGFGDRTYLGKIFKKYYGKTMTEERARQEITKKEYPLTVVTHDTINRVNLEPDME